MTWEREPNGLWEREEDSWRTWNQLRGGSSFNKPGAGVGGLQEQMWVLPGGSPRGRALGLNPGLAMCSRGSGYMASPLGASVSSSAKGL